MSKTTKNSNTTASENWARYVYGRDRGHREYINNAKRCEGMYLGAGEQWSEDDKAILTDEGRPFYEFNQIMPSINSALGYQIQNRMDISFKPRAGGGDLATATTLSKVVSQICDQQKVRWKETQVYGDGLIEQRGYFDVRIAFDDNMKGEVIVETLDPRDVIPDPDAKTYDPEHWPDVIISRWYTLDEIERMYGRQARLLAEQSHDVDNEDTQEDGDKNKFGTTGVMGGYDASRADQGERRCRVIDRQKAVHEMTDCIVFPESGDIKIADMMTPEQVADALANHGAVKARRMRKRIQWIVTTYSTTLFDKTSPYDCYTVIPYFAYFRRGKTRGMVDNAIGPQEALNKGISQFIHILNTTANSGWTVEQNSLTNMDVDELQQVGAKTGLVVEYKQGSQPPQKITPNQVPTGIDRLIDRATQALKDVTVPDSMRGLQGSAVSGVAKQADQFASQQQLAVPLDNLAYTRQLMAMRILKLVQRYYDSYRVFRITSTDPRTGKEVEDTLEINKFDPGTGTYLNDITVGTYDVVISEQPMQVTFENSQFQQALEMRKQGVAIPDSVVVRYSSLADKHEILEEMTNSATPDPTLQAKAALLDAQTKKTSSDATAQDVKTQYSATQTALILAQNPATAPLADKLLKSAGYVDKDASPIIPSAPAIPVQPVEGLPASTDPLTPASPAIGLEAGIETPQVDGASLDAA